MALFGQNKSPTTKHNAHSQWFYSVLRFKNRESSRVYCENAVYTAPKKPTHSHQRQASTSNMFCYYLTTIVKQLLLMLLLLKAVLAYCKMWNSSLDFVVLNKFSKFFSQFWIPFICGKLLWFLAFCVDLNFHLCSADCIRHCEHDNSLFIVVVAVVVLL